MSCTPTFANETRNRCGQEELLFHGRRFGASRYAGLDEVFFYPFGQPL